MLSQCQYGFSKSKSTESASIRLFNLVYSELYKGNYAVVILYDLSKALNSGKLRFIGIQSIMLDWIKLE